jgi:hypothetical protein
MTFLKSLYTVAIALLVVAFVGFGISAFYPSPEFPEPPAQLQFVGQNQTDEETKLIAEQQRKEEAFQQSFSDYNLVVSSISIGVAVLLLVASLLWMRVLPVIGDGATLGAVFTLFYGLIRAFMTDSAQFRFVAVAVGLVIVVALVYLRFIRSSKEELTPPDVTAGAGPAPQ